MAEGRGLHRGDIWDADLPEDIGRHSVVLLSRDIAMNRRHRAVVVLITSHVFGTRTEVPVSLEEGLDYDSVGRRRRRVHAGDWQSLRRRGALGSSKLAELEAALHVALGLGT